VTEDGKKAGSDDDLTVSGILRLARRNADRTRRTYAALGQTLVAGNMPGEIALTDWQRSILSQLLRQVVGDIYASMRWQVLAETEDDADAARAGWSSLASDSGDRVFAQMTKRDLLTDFALIEAIAHRLYQHQLEQATRPPERNRWSTEPSLDNPYEFFGEPLPEFSPVIRRIGAYVVDRSRRTDSYGNPILVPGEIQPVLYERLHWRVAAVLRHMLVEEFSDNLQQLESRIEKATTETIRHSLAIASAPTSSAEAARAIEDAGLLTIETVHRLLKAGEIPLFEESFARLAGIRPILLRRLIYEVDGKCFAVLNRALDVELAQASSIFALIRSGRTNRFRDTDPWQESLKTIYGSLSPVEANLVRNHWKRQPEFASALWEAEGSRPEETGNTPH
jgi:hypothetical protein